MNTRRSRSGAIFVTLVVLTILLGIISYEVIDARRMLATNAGVTRRSLQVLLVLIVNEESGLRGFAATGDRRFLDPYEQGRRVFRMTLLQARHAAENAQLPVVRSDLDAVESYHGRWVREVAEPILRERSAASALRAEVLGKYLVDRMRIRITHADEVAAAVTQREAVNIRLAIISSITGIVALSVILGAAALGSERRRADREREFARRLAASIDELKRQRASVLQLNQLKNDLIAVLAHDIKGPLTSIGGFAELLEEGALQGDAASDAARMIRVNSQQLATLTNDVLTLSRIEHGELDISLEHIDLLDLVRTVVASHLTERRIDVTATVEHAFVRGDAARLSQVLDNLLRNAIKYSAPDKPIEIIVEAADHHVRVRVRDDGMGIPPEDLPRLFRRFVRGSNARSAKIAGTGIGLFIVKMIVERHGGTVDVESTLGEGSLFTITLPSADTAVSWRPMRVTIVTPDTDLSGFVAFELRSRGYRVHECRSLDDLVHDGDLRADDVVLVDTEIASPQAVRIHAASKDVRIIGLGNETAKHGWDATLAQPFLVADLMSVIEGRDLSTNPLKGPSIEP